MKVKYVLHEGAKNKEKAAGQSGKKQKQQQQQEQKQPQQQPDAPDTSVASTTSAIDPNISVLSSPAAGRDRNKKGALELSHFSLLYQTVFN